MPSEKEMLLVVYGHIVEIRKARERTKRILLAAFSGMAFFIIVSFFGAIATRSFAYGALFGLMAFAVAYWGTFCAYKE